MHIGTMEITGKAALAPMAGVANRAMRTLCMRYGAAFCTGELTSARALVSGDRKSTRFLQSTPEEQPFGCQLFGADPDTVREAAGIAERYAPAFLDLNMGCPTPKIVSSGAGAALMRDPDLAGRIVRAAVDAVRLPVTVKIRTGWDERHITAVEIARAAEANGAVAVTVHARTRAQMYAPPCDYQTVAAVKAALRIPVVVNGDITCGADARRVLDATGCDAVAVGRAAMGYPFVFSEINTYLETGETLPAEPLQTRLAVLRELVEMMRQDSGDAVAFREARKHAAWAMRGLAGAAELRRLCAGISCEADLVAVCRRAAEWNPDA